MFLAFLIIVSTPFILYLNGLYLLLFNPVFYSWGFERNQVYNRYSNRSIPDATAKQLIEYFKSDKQDLPDIDLFDQKEKEHLLDVKFLIKQSLDNYFSFLLMSLFCFLLLYFLNKKKFVKKIGYLFLFGGLTTLFVTIVLIISSIKFDWIFTRFHLVFFPQGNWMFPNDHNLIMLFPKSFFFEGFAVVLFISLIQSFLLLLISSLLIIKYQEKNNKILLKKQKVFK